MKKKNSIALSRWLHDCCYNFLVWMVTIRRKMIRDMDASLPLVSEPRVGGGVRPPSPPRHDTTAPVEPTSTRVQPPRQAKTKDPEFHYTK